MRYLVLSDIHANLEALEATLAAADPYDSTLVLGDLVGYGADPNAVIECVRRLQPAVVIRGNHDKVAAGSKAWRVSTRSHGKRLSGRATRLPRRTAHGWRHCRKARRDRRHR